MPRDSGMTSPPDSEARPHPPRWVRDPVHGSSEAVCADCGVDFDRHPMTSPDRTEAGPIDIEPQGGEDFGEWLGRAMEALNPSDFATASLNRDRPYNGQPHTDEGERGRTLVEGLTMRDIKDCFVIGAFRATGKGLDEYPSNIYGIDWSDIDPMAVCQNMICAIEERMGIYPNVPPLTYTGPEEPTDA